MSVVHLMKVVRVLDKQGLTFLCRSFWLPPFQQSGNSGAPVLSAQHPQAIVLKVQCIHNDKPVLYGTGRAVDCTVNLLNPGIPAEQMTDLLLQLVRQLVVAAPHGPVDVSSLLVPFVSVHSGSCAMILHSTGSCKGRRKQCHPFSGH